MVEILTRTLLEIWTDGGRDARREARLRRALLARRLAAFLDPNTLQRWN